MAVVHVSEIYPLLQYLLFGRGVGVGLSSTEITSYAGSIAGQVGQLSNNYFPFCC